MPKTTHQHRLQSRREADREFLSLMITTGKALGKQSPDREKRHAATRVTRRLQLLMF